MNDSQVSIIVVSYNNFKYIYECIDSILMQSYSNIQLIISDDCSDDFDRRSLERYLRRKRKENIVDIIINRNNVNMGTVKHLTVARKFCTGKFITTMAADDAYATVDAIESLVNEYKKNNGQIKVITSLAMMCGNKLSDQKGIFTDKKDIDLINNGTSTDLFNELSYRAIISASGTLIERTIYDEIGLFENYEFIEDCSMHLRLVRMGYKIYCLEKVTYLHRDGGISHGNKRVSNDIWLRYYKDLIRIFEYEVEPFRDIMSEEAYERALQYYKWHKDRYEKECKEYYEKNNPKIVFYCRKNVAAKGDFTLYYRLGSYIADNFNINVYCVNNSVPELQTQYCNSKINFCDINKDNLSDFEGATFVTAFNQLFFLYDEIKKIKNAKIFLLFLHPNIIDWMLIQIPQKAFSLDSFFDLLVKNQACGFQDESNLLAFKNYYKKSFVDNYFPVVIDERENNNLEIIKKHVNDKINIAWFGRLDKDKVYSLINFLDNLYDACENQSVVIHLIGDGDGILCINFNKYTPKFTFVFNSFLYGKDKDDYLKENVDLVVAMGMSSIDCAANSIPVVLPIVTMKPTRVDKYMYIYDTRNFCVGWSESDLKKIDCKMHSISEIIKNIREDNVEIGEKCSKFVYDNFLVKNNASNAVKLINNSTLTLKKIKKNKVFLFQIFLYKLYRKIVSRDVNYLDYINLRNKYIRFSKLPFKEKIYKFFKKGIKFLKNRLHTRRGE